MARQNMLLTNPKDLGNGTTQHHLMVNYIYVSDTAFTFYSVQGNVITIPIDITFAGYLTAIENAAKFIYDVP
jgi:hypothetical protein